MITVFESHNGGLALSQHINITICVPISLLPGFQLNILVAGSNDAPSGKFMAEAEYVRVSHSASGSVAFIVNSKDSFARMLMSLIGSITGRLLVLVTVILTVSVAHCGGVPLSQQENVITCVPTSAHVGSQLNTPVDGSMEAPFGNGVAE